MSVGYGDPAHPAKASFRSITGVAFLNSLCSLRDDPGSYPTVSRNEDSLHCLVKNCGLRWNEKLRRWMSSTEELMTQGFVVGPIAKARFPEVSCSFNVQRQGRTPLAIKHAAGDTVHPQSSGLCSFWMVQHVLVPSATQSAGSTGVVGDTVPDAKLQESKEPVRAIAPRPPATPMHSVRLPTPSASRPSSLLDAVHEICSKRQRCD